MAASPFTETIRTERLLLRPVEVSDVELLWADISDPEIAKLMAWNAHSHRSQTLEFLKSEVERYQSKRGVTWVILMDGAFCGIISIISVTRTHRALTFDRGELAYWIGRKFQQRGIATEAGRAVVKHAFQKLGLHKLVVSHHSGNMSSQALIKRLGFRYIGTQKAEFRKNGVWYDHWLYEMLDSEWGESPGIGNDHHRAD
jgi:RimJ/RimL family protein N-acetyltransferase